MEGSSRLRPEGLKLERSERQVGRAQLEEFVEGILGDEVHAKRVESLIDGVDGVLHTASLGVRAIGQGLAAAQGLVPRHAIKQVDRLLSNSKLGMETILCRWVRFVVAGRAEIFANFDWTEFEDSDQSLVVLGMQTEHGRSTPLAWKSVTRSELKDQRNDHEDELLVLFATLVPEGVRVTVVADRGFADSKRCWRIHCSRCWVRRGRDSVWYECSEQHGPDSFRSSGRDFCSTSCFPRYGQTACIC